MVPHHDDTDLVTHALRYAEMGLPVFPLVPGGKVPLAGSSGLHDATTDPQAIRELWAPWPDANIGLATGRGGVVVVDVDPRHGGDQALAALEAEYEPLPPAPTVRTGDGWHLYFKATRPHIPSRDLSPGLELRADGRLVVLPPSLHPSGRRYAWGDWPIDPDDLPPLPTWLRALRTMPALRAPIAAEGIDRTLGGGTDLGTALARALSDPETLTHVLPVLAIPRDANPAQSRAFRCPLGCGDRHPSASLWRHPRTGTVLLRSWHKCQGLEYLTLPMVYAGQRGAGYRWLRGASLAAWSLRLLVDAGIVAAPPDPPRLLHAPAPALAVYRAFMQTTAAAEALAGNRAGIAFTRRFGAALTGLSERDVRTGWEYLRDHGYVTQAAAREGIRPALWTPATPPHGGRDEGYAQREYSLRAMPVVPPVGGCGREAAEMDGAA